MYFSVLARSGSWYVSRQRFFVKIQKFDLSLNRHPNVARTDHFSAIRSTEIRNTRVDATKRSFPAVLDRLGAWCPPYLRKSWFGTFCHACADLHVYTLGGRVKQGRIFEKPTKICCKSAKHRPRQLESRFLRVFYCEKKWNACGDWCFLRTSRNSRKLIGTRRSANARKHGKTQPGC